MFLCLQSYGPMRSATSTRCTRYVTPLGRLRASAALLCHTISANPHKASLAIGLVCLAKLSNTAHREFPPAIELYSMLWYHRWRCAFLPTEVPCAESNYKTLRLQGMCQGLVTCLPTEVLLFYLQPRPRNNPYLSNRTACAPLSTTFCKDTSCLQPILQRARHSTMAV